ncbi:MAG TPA: ABC transporter ATP-binding protein [Longimicrobiales bacterium]
MSALLEARDVVRRRDGRVIVQIDRLVLERGRVTALLGPNGAGKSTLLRMLLGLEPTDGGELLLDGRVVRAGDPALRRRSAATLQRPTLFAGTVRSNVLFGLRARGATSADALGAADEALRAMGIGHLADADARRLSGGEAQRVAVARALAVRPDLLALDEPSAGLDVAARRELHERLDDSVRALAGATLIVTHDAADAFALADHIIVLEGGRVTQQGNAHELVSAPATPFVAAFTGAELLIDGVVAESDGGMVVVRLSTGDLVTAVASQASLAIGARAHVAYRPEDVVLARGGAATSARNRLRATVVGSTPVGGLLRVRLDAGLPLVSLVTRAAADELALRAGAEVTAQLKAAALRAFPAATARGAA